MNYKSHSTVITHSVYVYIPNSSSRQVLQSGMSFIFILGTCTCKLSKWMDEMLTNGIREIAYLQSYDYIDFLLPQFFKSSSKKLQCFIKTYGINKVLWNETRCWIPSVGHKNWTRKCSRCIPVSLPLLNTWVAWNLWTSQPLIISPPCSN